MSKSEGDNHHYSLKDKYRSFGIGSQRKKTFAIASIVLAGLLFFSSFTSAFFNLASLINNNNSDYAYAQTIQDILAGKPVPLGSKTVPPELSATAINSGKPPSVDNFNIIDGYKIEPVLWNLTFPSSVAFDDKGN